MQMLSRNRVRHKPGHGSSISILLIQLILINLLVPLVHADYDSSRPISNQEFRVIGWYINNIAYVFDGSNFISAAVPSTTAGTPLVYASYSPIPPGGFSFGSINFCFAGNKPYCYKADATGQAVIASLNPPNIAGIDLIVKLDTPYRATGYCNDATDKCEIFTSTTGLAPTASSSSQYWSTYTRRSKATPAASSIVPSFAPASLQTTSNGATNTGCDANHCYENYPLANGTAVWQIVAIRLPYQTRLALPNIQAQPAGWCEGLSVSTSNTDTIASYSWCVRWVQSTAASKGQFKIFPFGGSSTDVTIQEGNPLPTPPRIAPPNRQRGLAFSASDYDGSTTYEWGWDDTAAWSYDSSSDFFYTSSVGMQVPAGSMPILNTEGAVGLTLSSSANTFDAFFASDTPINSSPFQNPGYIDASNNAFVYDASSRNWFAFNLNGATAAITLPQGPVYKVSTPTESHTECQGNFCYTYDTTTSKWSEPALNLLGSQKLIQRTGFLSSQQAPHPAGFQARQSVLISHA
jgi:hypothetical protein